MSDEQSSSDLPPDDSAAEPAQAEAKPKKPRSGIERAVVWSAIGILLVVAGIQAMQAYGYTRSKGRIDAALKEVESSQAEFEELDLGEAEALMSGHWKKSEVRHKDWDRFIVYTWPGIYADYRLLLTIGADKVNPIVIGYQTNTESSDHSDLIMGLAEGDLAAANGDGASGGPEAAGPPMAGMGMPPGMGPPGGPPRQRIDWDALDKDGDGKISREEAPEQVQLIFDRIDTNGDGFIDEAELAEMRRRREERRAQEGDAGERRRPQRPEASADERESKPDDEPAPPAKPEGDEEEKSAE